MNKGNDDLLFGQPKDLDEAVETLIAFYGEDSLRKTFKDGISLYDSKPLYGMAEFIRNHWFLWWHKEHNSEWFPVSKPPLLRFFHEVGITHPDDISDILFSAIWHRMRGETFAMQATIASLQEYWKEQGFPDGKPDINTL